MAKLIIHAGLGKTGTSAFQEAMIANDAHLRQSGVVFVGPQVSRIVAGNQEFALQGAAGRPEIVGNTLQILERVAFADSHIKRVIWSNEKIGMSQSLPAVVQTIRDFMDQTTVFDDLEVLICFRRQDEWIESAYRQWGAKHKTSDKPGVERPLQWLKRNRRLLDYLGQYKNWSELGESQVRVLSYDDIQISGGTAHYLFKLLNIPHQPEDLDAFSQSHTSMDAARSYMSAVYNASHEGSVKPYAFRDFMSFYELPKLDDLNRAFFSKETCDELLAEYDEDNKKLAQMALGRNEMFVAERSGIHRQYTNHTEDALIYLTKIAADQHHLIMAQDDRITALQERLDAQGLRSFFAGVAKVFSKKRR